MTTPTEKPGPKAPTRLTGDDGRVALNDHVVAKAEQARLRHGLYIDSDAVVKMLDDRSVVRYPVGIRFDAEALQPGEFAWAMQTGDQPADGWCLFIHPYFEDQPDVWGLLIAYHLPSINYGDIVNAEQCELFGAALLGMEKEAYYQALCELADTIPVESVTAVEDC